jgi:hypothetical protein
LLSFEQREQQQEKEKKQEQKTISKNHKGFDEEQEIVVMNVLKDKFPK